MNTKIIENLSLLSVTICISSIYCFPDKSIYLFYNLLFIKYNGLIGTNILTGFICYNRRIIYKFLNSIKFELDEIIFSFKKKQDSIIDYEKLSDVDKKLTYIDTILETQEFTQEQARKIGFTIDEHKNILERLKINGLIEKGKHNKNIIIANKEQLTKLFTTGNLIKINNRLNLETTTV